MKRTRLWSALALAVPAGAAMVFVTTSALALTGSASAGGTPTTPASDVTVAAPAAPAAGTTALAAVNVASATPSTPPPTALACDRAPWGWRVQGAPANFSAGDRGGDYLWHDATGFHLRVTHRGDGRVVYSGVITSSAPMRMDPVKLEKGDVARLSADHRSLIFAFADHGYIDGVNFHTDCAARLTVSHLNAGSDRLPTGRVYLGATQAHPAHVPFVVRRIHAG